MAAPPPSVGPPTNQSMQPRPAAVAAMPSMPGGNGGRARARGPPPAGGAMGDLAGKVDRMALGPRGRRRGGGLDAMVFDAPSRPGVLQENALYGNQLQFRKILYVHYIFFHS